MEVILLERVEKLGAIGDVVRVKDGFARNYLLPRKKALRANEANRKVFEANRDRIVSDNAARRGEAEKESKTIDGTSITLIRRFINGESVMQAHRSHFYQRALDNGFSVYQIVGRVFILNLILAGLALAYAMNSGRVFAGTDGWITRMKGVRATLATGAASRMKLKLSMS